MLEFRASWTGMSDRKVHFSVPIHQVEYLDKQWETASRLARDGSDWLRMGLDRQRFQDRIERTGEILNEILDPQFRQQIYKERFENFAADTRQQQQSLQQQQQSHCPQQQQHQQNNRRARSRRNARKRNRNNRGRRKRR